ncbi:hypothetical protein B5X24_HaOG204439 [Helicoverpa armigera]|uniref:Sugar phosphate transporter domain-containing protein n=1 Tax=Helicoverpa armigera TaxID=29058 RepID=A0A2W1BUT1_HELAM|nr:hypothetical protein B5X24_HaOG204439 [Helicoverpa armigera]
MGTEGSRREALTVVLLCGAWYAASSASNVVGKLVLTDFPFPVTVTMVQLLSVVLLSAPALAACGVRRQTDFPRRYYWRTLVPLAFAKFLTTICSQVSIWKVPISYAHTDSSSQMGFSRTLRVRDRPLRVPWKIQDFHMAVAAFSVLSRVTPLAYAVASAAKRAAVVGASLLLLRNPAPPLNLLGMALAALGVLAYNRAKLQARRAPTLPV